jgi:hypothetical protein
LNQGYHGWGEKLSNHPANNSNLMNKRILIITLVIGMLVSSATAKAKDAQSWINAINTSIQKAVGAQIDDQIPGYNRGDDQLSLSSGGIECPAKVASVRQAAKLLTDRLKLDFGDSLEQVRVMPFAPDLLAMAKIHDGGLEVTISISIFKRSSSRVIMFPVILARTAQ